MLTAKSAVITDSTSGIGREAVMRDVLLAAQPTKQFVRLGQIGALVVYLAGAAMASVMGSALTMDGGRTAQ